MKKRLFALFLSVCLLISALPTALAADTAVTVTVAGTQDYSEAQDVVTLVNEQRAENGLDALTHNATLNELAMQRAAEISLYFAHELPDGTDWQTFARNWSYSGATTWGENIAIGQTSAADAMESWMNSEGHRENILTAEYTQIGVGVFEADGIFCWVQLFGNSTTDTATTSQTGRTAAAVEVSILQSRLGQTPTGSKSLEIEEGDTYSLTIQATNSQFTSMNPTLVPTAASSDASVATASVAEDGTVTVTAVAPGSASITLPVYDGQSDAYTLNITVPGEEATQPTETEPEPTVTEPEPTETEPEPTETEPEPTETEPEPTETEPEPTETEPEPTETEPEPTETEPEPTETEPEPTETEPEPTETEPEPTETEPEPTETEPEPTETEPAQYPITITVNGCGAAGTDKQYAAEGEEVTLTVEADWSYYISDVAFDFQGTYDGTATLVDHISERRDIMTYEIIMSDGPLEINITVEAGFRIHLYQTEGGTATVNKETAQQGESVILSIDPDPGYIVDKILYYTYGSDSMDADYLGDDDYQLTMNDGTLELYVYFLQSDHPFVDVKESDYFYKPVLWATQYGITNGINATHFGPNKTCTRAEVVTFLWRTAGCPEPETTVNPFKDIQESDYFYKAVLWAVENGITTGMYPDQFGPNKSCTRAQVATFLWRAVGQPKASSNYDPFVDLDPNQYYYDAILWAVEYGITNGTGNGKFSPNASCTRGQIVTFLYRTFY